MAEPISIQQLKDASEDAISLAEFIYKPASSMVKRRLAPDMHTLDFYTTLMENLVIGKVRAQDVSTADGSTQEVKNTEFRNELDSLPFEDGFLSDAYINVAHKSITDYRSLENKLKESISILDFFTLEERTEYNLNPNIFDAHRPVQAFFDFIAVNNVGVAYASGKYAISKGIVFNVTNGLNSVRTVIGELDLQCLSSMEAAMEATLQQDFNWFGKLVVRGTGGVSLNSRSCEDGVRLYASARCFFSKIVARNFYRHGIFVPNDATFLNIRDIRTSDCGSGHYDTGSQLTSFTIGEKTGSSGAVSQRQKITVTDLPKSGDTSYFHVLIDGQPYFVNSVDELTKELIIFPWLPSNAVAGSLKYLYGSGIAIYGGDSSEVTVGMVDAVRTSVAFLNGALYSANIGTLQTQNCGVALQHGSSPASATVGGTLQNLYCEANNIDILRTTRAEANFFIASNVALDLKKTKYSCAARATDDSLYEFNNLNGFSLFYKGVLQERATLGAFELTDSTPKTAYGNSYAVQLTIDADILDAFSGIDSKTIMFMGSGLQRQPTGTITVTAPTGFTINGLPSIDFSNLNKPLVLQVGLLTATKNLIAVSNSELSSTATYDFPPLAASSQQSTTVPLVGAKTGDIVSVSFSRNLQGTRLWAEVTTNDIVTVYHRNDTTAPIDIASGTLKVRVT